MAIGVDSSDYKLPLFCNTHGVSEHQVFFSAGWSETHFSDEVIDMAYDHYAAMGEIPSWVLIHIDNVTNGDDTFKPDKGNSTIMA